MKFKKLLAAILSGVILLGTLPFATITASAAISGTTGDCTWSLNGTVLTISGNGAMSDDGSQPWGTQITEVIIQDGVTNVGYGAFMNCTSLTSVKLSNNLTSIGGFAFESCTSLASIDIPNSVKDICEVSFRHCTSLKSINIPYGVQRIFDCAFEDCIALTTINIPKSIIDIWGGAFCACDSLENVYYCGTGEEWNNINIIEAQNENLISAERHFHNFKNKVCTICGVTDNIFIYDFSYVLSDGEATITGYTSNKNDIIIPEAVGEYPVTKIGEVAFADYTNLTGVTIPDSVTEIKWGAFMNCTSLTSVKLSNNLTSIGGMAFSNCSSLETIDLPNSLVDIWEVSFRNCVSLATLNIPHNVKNIYDFAFYGCTSLSSINIPNSIENIYTGAFEDCISLKDVYYCDSNDEWDNINIFDYNTYLTSANRYYHNFENNVCIYCGEQGANPATDFTYTINNGKVTITGCTSTDKKIVVPETIEDYPVIEIGESAFKYCDTVEQIVLSNGIEKIGSRAFWFCQNLEKIIIPDTVVTIDDWAFTGCYNIISITIPQNVTYIGIHAFDSCRSLLSIKVSEQNEYFCDIDGVLFSKDKTVLIRYPIATKCESYKIPTGVTKIENVAFEDCEKLTNVIIPDSVDKIGISAFASCGNLTSISIPYSVATICEKAFSYCRNLMNIMVDENNTEFCDIDGVLFSKDKSVLIQYPIGKETTSYTIPNTTTNIYDYAYKGNDTVFAKGGN